MNPTDRLAPPPQTLLALIALWGPVLCAAGAADPSETDVVRRQAAEILDIAKVRGGLCVQVGLSRLEVPGRLARDAQFLVLGLDADAQRVFEARRVLQKTGRYGQITCQQADPARLPLSEDVAALLIAESASSGSVNLAEVFRVLRPGGVGLIGLPDAARADRLKQEAARAGFKKAEVVKRSTLWLRVAKPVPAALDRWTHPRYDATGNAVSGDTDASPPRRIRWLAGPLQGTGDMVTAEGRCFYGNLYARDAFSGVRLWSRPLTRGGVRPVLGGGMLFAVEKGEVHGLDPATGETVRVYSHAGRPAEMYFADGVLVTVDHASVRAVDTLSGKPLWSRKTGSARRLWLRRATIPGCLTIGGGAVTFVEGNPRRGQKPTLISLDLKTGRDRWRFRARAYRHESDAYDWLSRATSCTYHDGRLAFEASTFDDFGTDSSIHILDAATGEVLWSRTYSPHGAHHKQARALFANGLAWIVMNRTIEGLDIATGEVKRTWKGGRGHCYPPVATQRYVFSGEMSITNLTSGTLDEHPITKGACSRVGGLIPANGLLYAFPKGCSCWPMLKGYVAMAGAADEPAAKESRPEDFPLTVGPARLPEKPEAVDARNEWPCYRHDANRSAAAGGPLPEKFDVLWRRQVVPADSDRPEDWRQNAFVSGVITPPVVAGGTALVAAADLHSVHAYDAKTGQPLWQFTANGRIDTPPTIARGLCLFGTRTGWVYCLRLADGKEIWRLRAAASERQIVAHGQIESPWPVPGSVLVIGDTVYFAAGRHYLADGGIRVFAAELASGKVRWVGPVNELPGHQYYGASGLEFDNVDLLVREAGSVTMSRWQFDRRSGKMTLVPKSGFFRTGEDGVMAPRGCWSYGPRQTHGRKERSIKRPLAAWAGSRLILTTDDRRGLLRRDFDFAGGEKFSDQWYSVRIRNKTKETGGDFTRAQRLAHGAKWKIDAIATSPISGLLLAGDRCLIVDEKGGLALLATDDGDVLGRASLPAAAVWDGVASAYGRLYVSAGDGSLICLGAK